MLGGQSRAHLLSRYSARRVFLQSVVSRRHLLSKPVFDGTISGHEDAQPVSHYFAFGRVLARLHLCADKIAISLGSVILNCCVERIQSSIGFNPTQSYRIYTAHPAGESSKKPGLAPGFSLYTASDNRCCPTRRAGPADHRAACAMQIT